MNNLFRKAVEQLIAKEILSKGIDAAAQLGMTYDQYKNLRTERTQFTKGQWHNFLINLKRLDPE